MSEQKLLINEVGTVAERITKLVDHFCKGNKTAFGRAADIQSGVLAGIVGGRGSKPGFEILQKLLTAYPAVSAEWLLFGRGPMLQGRLPHSKTISEFITEYKTHRDGKSEMTAVLISRDEVRRQALNLMGDESRAAEQLKLEALEIDYEELIARRNKQAHTAILTATEAFATREQYEALSQKLAYFEKFMDAVLDSAPAGLARIFREQFPRPIFDDDERTLAERAARKREENPGQ